MNKVILYIATSLDGFIADSDGSVDWLPQPETSEDLEMVGYPQLMDRIGIIVMGSRSYKQILTFGEWGWPDKQTYVFTSQPLSSELASIEFTKDTPRIFMEKIKKSQPNKNIWLLGGAQLAQSFAREHLIDEIILTIIPKKLQQGIALNVPLEDFYLNAEKPCMDGIVQKVYLKKE
jgi:dihydrofolate reductase